MTTIDTLAAGKNINDSLKNLDLQGGGGGAVAEFDPLATYTLGNFTVYQGNLYRHNGGVDTGNPDVSPSWDYRGTASITEFDPLLAYDTGKVVDVDGNYFRRTSNTPGVVAAPPLGGNLLWEAVEVGGVKYALSQANSSSYSSNVYDGSVDFFTGDALEIRSRFDATPSGHARFSELTGILDNASNGDPTQQYSIRYSARGTIHLPASVETGSWLIVLGYLTYDISNFTPPFTVTPVKAVDTVDAGLGTTQLILLEWDFLLHDYIDERRVVPTFQLMHPNANTAIVYGAGNPLTVSKFNSSGAFGAGNHSTIERVG